MRQREHHELSDEARRELNALDRALAGEPVDAEFDAVARLAWDMREARETPSADFATRLDERVANGFRPEAGSSPSAGARLREWLAGVKPMRALAPAGALATFLIVASVAVLQSGGGEDAPAPDTQTTSLDAAAPAESDRQGAPQSAPLLDEEAGVGEAAAPVPGADTAPPSANPDRPAPGQEREVERSASLALSTDGEEFENVTDGVVSVTDSHEGFVTSSDESVAGDTSRAEFELSIPTDELSATLAELSELAHVEARSEDTLDITAPTVDARQRLTDARAEISGLLEQLENADSPKETREIRTELDLARQEAAQAKAEVRRLAQRKNYADVRVTVTADGGGDGDWGIEEAIDDIGGALSTAGGIALVSAAILLPIGLVIALVAFAWRRSVRRGRERALGD